MSLEYQKRVRCLDEGCPYISLPYYDDEDVYIHPMHDKFIIERRKLGEWEEVK